jgi:NADH dehydrogenase
MVRDFRHIRPESARVILLEGRERVLPPYPPDLSEKARKQLVDLGVEVLTNSVVTDVNDREVHIGERVIPTRTVLWGAGVQASPSPAPSASHSIAPAASSSSPISRSPAIRKCS